jgi:hypothetical protein
MDNFDMIESSKKYDHMDKMLKTLQQKLNSVTTDEEKKLIRDNIKDIEIGIQQEECLVALNISRQMRKNLPDMNEEDSKELNAIDAKLLVSLVPSS